MRLTLLAPSSDPARRALRTAAFTLALAASALAGNGTVVGFDGPNTGGWTFGPPPVIESGGGNPGAWLHASTDTFAPQLHTTVASTAFSGDWRARKVVSLGVDLKTVATQFAFSRPLSVILSSGACQIYFVGSALVPQPAAGWKAFDFAIDSQSTTMPAGWAVYSGPCTQPDAAWNTVMTNVTEVRFFYGDPTFFFIFDIWNVGADNVRIFCDPFTALGGALAGTAGLPQLAGQGTLAPVTPVTLTLSNAKPSSAAALFVGLSALNAPFKGGTLVPNPDVLLTGLLTNAGGTLTLVANWPAGIPPAFAFYFQEWIVDAAGPQGFAASNALQGLTP